ncbi:MAG: U32 family peptidase [Spirochaetales bacterium]|nr:U32 family peptidase [Spirochaetales bacterium]
MDKSELLAPAGSLDSAMAALENGADAVYCGLQDFSARKGARNFTWEQLFRLRAWTLENRKKIYITLNTIIRENELHRITDTLYGLEELGVDSIILQDPGLARIIRKHFPGLTLHGSTQMAVHNLSGLKVLQELGFTRVVLPRELTLKEMEGFRSKIPEMELEVFIHGAQCYGFSGMCLASGMLLGRSANRGECGQICRTWFTKGQEKGYFLSSTDLWAGPEVLKLQEMGVSSLKIEGRMKSPAYTAAVSRYYRALLDGRPEASLKELENDLKIAFSRQSGTGHLKSRKGLHMVDTLYPGHRGLPLGKVTNSSGRQAALNSPVDLHKRDGLMFFDKKGEPRPFSLDAQKTLKKGRVSLSIPGGSPPAGTMLYKVQSHDFHSKAFNENSLPVFKKSLSGLLRFTPGTMDVQIPEIEFQKAYPLASEESTGSQGPEEKIKNEFARSGAFPFILNSLELVSEGPDLSTRFFPPSLLKKVRQKAYQDLQDHLVNRKQNLLEAVHKELDLDAGKVASLLEPLPRRSSISPTGSDLSVILPEEAEHSEAVRTGDCLYYPLSPLVFPEGEEFFLKGLISNFRKYPGDKKCVGIGNWGHIGFYRELKKEDDSLGCYGDTGMLLAISQGVLLMRELLGPDFIAAYGWLEAAEEDLPGALSPVDREFRPPLFISRNCFKKHSLGGSCSGCSRNLEYPLVQKDRSYRVYVKHCLTWIFAAEDSDDERG